MRVNGVSGAVRTIRSTFLVRVFSVLSAYSVVTFHTRPPNTRKARNKAEQGSAIVQSEPPVLGLPGRAPTAAIFTSDVSLPVAESMSILYTTSTFFRIQSLDH